VKILHAMKRAGCGLALLPLLTGATDTSCGLCTGDSERQETIPITLDITTNLSFSRAAATGKSGGQIRIDPVTGARQLGGGVVDLGGAALAGSAIVRGEPGRPVRIDMPANVRMTSSTGGSIEINDIQTSLSAAPRLDSFGQLSFHFGGRITVTGNVAGTFRGRIPITAEYE
jgi:Domain of unknown function (DUF4402)